MNNKGQSLILFVLLIPLIILISAFFIESANIYYNSTKIKNIVKESCKYEGWEDYIIQNEKNAKIIYGEKIVVEEEIESLFSKIIGIKTFHIKRIRTCGEENE